MLRFTDSFDHYATFGQKWSAASSPTGAPNTTVPRFGTGCYSQPNSRWLRHALDAQPTWILGTALMPTGEFAHEIITLMDSNSHQLLLQLVRSTGTFNLYRGYFAALLASGSVPMPLNVYKYAVLKATIHDTLGEAELRVNGQTIFSVSGIDTKATANASANQIGLGEQTGNDSIGIVYDDLVVCDATGAINNDIFDDVRVGSLYPSGDGATSDLVGSDSDSINNSLLVDEHPPNDDTDYVESSTIGDKDTYAYTNLVSTSGSVLGVQMLPYARKTDAGTRSIASITRLGASEEDSADEPLADSYQYLPDIRELDPDGNPWTIANVNVAEFGVKVAA